MGLSKALMHCRAQLHSDCTGQSSVEFVIVFAGIALVVWGIASLSGAFSDGVFVEHALQSASHKISGVYAGVFTDIFMY